MATTFELPPDYEISGFSREDLLQLLKFVMPGYENHFLMALAGIRINSVLDEMRPAIEALRADTEMRRKTLNLQD